jgi:hypothetical protein
MTKSPVARLRNQRGVTTAEYAVVTAAGAGFGALLLKLLTSDWGQALLERILDFFLGMIGLG